MFDTLGSDIYRTWTEEQRRTEIGRLVEGYRSGLPVMIMLQMASAIAGNPGSAREHLAALLPAEDRHLIVGRLKGQEQSMAASFLM